MNEQFEKYWHDEEPPFLPLPFPNDHQELKEWCRHAFIAGMKIMDERQKQTVIAGLSGIRELGFCSLCGHPVYGFDDTEQPFIHGTCSQVREDIAREIVQFIVDQGTIDAGWDKEQVYSVSNEDLTEIRKKFGLEI